MDMARITSFPKGTRFKYTWRPYQERILMQLEEYLDDQHLHVVAAPGSGKTVLGLEVVRRLSQPTLILAPTIAIRNQWVERLIELFLPDTNTTPEWISLDVREPNFLTVSTYQGLHTILSKELDEDEFAEEEGIPVKNESGNYDIVDVVTQLRKIGVKTIVLDEAHHLRANWWKSITEIVEGLEDITIVALTATPPYDVSITEWEKYLALCGHVDAEVAVPELVLEDNLCPHQDLVLFTTPAFSENQELSDFKDEIQRFKDDLLTNTEFIEYLKNNEWLKETDSFIEEILENPDYFSSILIFLNNLGYKIPVNSLSLIVDSDRDIPKLTDDWLEILLEESLYPKGIPRKEIPQFVLDLRQRLSKIGALENRRISLSRSKRVESTLKKSISKLQAMLAISLVETEALGKNLRMVVLTDFIRKAFLPISIDDIRDPEKMGVIPIFESIRKLQLKDCSLGVLSGSLVIIPKMSVELLKECAVECNFNYDLLRPRPLIHDEEFLRLDVNDSNRQVIVTLITELFSRGGVNILVGTKSLLGEGWDAPTINTLVLASFVGSYMLSNQMRGRAIRTERGNPEKTANIWHLVCVEKNSEDAGHDYDTIVRRFKAFSGVSSIEPVIENGFARMGIKEPPFSEEDIKLINSQMSEKARARDSMRASWDVALKRGDEGVRLVEDVKAKRIHLPRTFVFKNTLTAVMWELIYILGFFLAGRIPGLVFPFGNLELWILSFLPMIGFFIFAARFFPKFLKAIILFFRHGPIKSSMVQIGKALLFTLCEVGLIKTERKRVKVNVEDAGKGSVFCRIDGGTKREQGIFLTALKEILDPIHNPRYLLVRKSTFRGTMMRRDYHSVPSILGTKREHADIFAKMWTGFVGDMELIYTRSKEGRIALLKARHYSLSSGLLPRTERISQWK